LKSADADHPTSPDTTKANAMKTVLDNKGWWVSQAIQEDKAWAKGPLTTLVGALEA
jgi:hypothetical protein